MILNIIQAGDPVLRQHARSISIEEILSDPIQELIEMMRNTMRDAPGVGLAAPQVGQSIPLVVIEDRERYMERLTQDQITERERRPIDFHVLINPRLSIDEEDPVMFFEACLSIAGFSALVPRARSVRVKALNERGEPVEIAASGWYARILQHEIDHLKGVLYIDRMHSQSFTNSENLNRHWKDKPIHEILAEE